MAAAVRDRSIALDPEDVLDFLPPYTSQTRKGTPLMAAPAPTTAVVEMESNENSTLDCDYHGCFFCSGPETD